MATLDLESVVDTAVSLADDAGLGAVSLSAVPAMAASSHVASMRRLTQEEYRNSIADIFGKEIDRFSFAIEKHSSDRAGSALQHLAQNVLEGH